MDAVGYFVQFGDKDKAASTPMDVLDLSYQHLASSLAWARRCGARHALPGALTESLTSSARSFRGCSLLLLHTMAGHSL